MPSPFPGMDPWLEAPGVFPDLHNRMISQLSNMMADTLPKPYYSALGSRVYQDDADWIRETDASILDPRRTPVLGHSDSSGVAVAIEYATQPIVFELLRDPVDEWTLDIHSIDGHRLITSIEILSPSNKRKTSKGRKAYRKKQRDMLLQNVNLVEIDLLRGGMHTTRIEKSRLREQCGRSFDYHVCVSRQHPRHRYEVYAFRMDDPLPTINIPLDGKTVDLKLGLQEAIAFCYEAGHYERRVNYGDEPNPTLDSRQSRWTSQLIQQQKTQQP